MVQQTSPQKQNAAPQQVKQVKQTKSTASSGDTGHRNYISEALAKESLGAQLKAADKEGLHIALILGQKEIYEGTVILRDLANGMQEAIMNDKLIAEIKKRFK